MIRSSKHTLKYTNPGKLSDIHKFLKEYRRLAQELVDYVWENGIPSRDFDVTTSKLSCPSYLPNDLLKQFDSWFSARMKQCVGKQVCGMIKAAVKKQSQRFYMMAKLQRDGESIEHLQRKIDTAPLVKPNCARIKPELDSRFIDFEKTTGEFDEFVRITTIGNEMQLKLPIRLTKVSEKWESEGERKKAVRLSHKNLTLMFEIEESPTSGDQIVGCDQGMKKTAVLSNGQQTDKCPHGHDLTSIQDTLDRRKPSSKGFRRAQAHRKNYINWSLKQLDFSNISEMRLEKIEDLRRGKRQHVSKMKHWTYPLIKDKLTALSETEGFTLSLVDNVYRSQRCSQCGFVRKVQRKDETFKCRQCNYFADADLNAAFNLELDLPKVPYWVRRQQLNRSEGFYWTFDGFSTVGHEPIVRDTA